MFIIDGILILLIGLFSGAYGIMVGAGGGFILVPALLIIMHMPPSMAAGTGLVVVLINSLSGISSFIKQKRIDYSLILFIVIGAVPGTVIGVYLTKTLPVQVFYRSFALMIILLSIFLFFKNLRDTKNTDKQYRTTSKRQKFSLLLVGIVMGVITTFFGIGGGWLMVPILIYIYGLSPYRATATSIFALCLYSSIGVIVHIYEGHVNWYIAAWAGLGALFGAQIGVYLSNRISGKLTIYLLSALLLIIGVKMLFK